MADASKIEWTDATWNPVTGCTKVSPGCDHCYAETFAERWRGTPGHPYEQGFDLRLWPDRLDQPLRSALVATRRGSPAGAATQLGPINASTALLAEKPAGPPGSGCQIWRKKISPAASVDGSWPGAVKPPSGPGTIWFLMRILAKVPRIITS